jgi:hypothetical protein
MKEGRDDPDIAGILAGGPAGKQRVDEPAAALVVRTDASGKRDKRVGIAGTARVVKGNQRVPRVAIIVAPGKDWCDNGG